MMKTVTTNLMFEHNAEEAVNLYVSLFDAVFGSTKGGSRIIKSLNFGTQELKALEEVPEASADTLPGPAGTVKTIRFQLNGEEFLAVNGGGYFGKFHESMSLYVSCNDQAQIDALWRKLSAEGEEKTCGWVKDKFGVSWQIAPAIIQDIMEGPDQDRAQRVMLALYKMKKIDVEKIMKA